MNNQTSLYYALSGVSYYRHIKDRKRLALLKKEVEKEAEFFFVNRHVRNELWNQKYFHILISVFCVNLLARRVERKMFRSFCRYKGKFSPYAPATLVALREYNENRSFFKFELDKFIFLKDLVVAINKRVNEFCRQKECQFRAEFMVHSNSSIGVEMEFSNKGHTAGRFFESGKNDALLNFSKYHHYHLMKFMWRFGAYVDADTPYKQYLRRGGFLEYTFTRPDGAFKPSEPLTSSPRLAARLIDEAMKFTPVRPHSMHVTFQITADSKKLPRLSFDELLFMFMVTGHFVDTGKGIVESRISEGNMKDWAVIRDRRNDDGWVLTVEFTHMRACRDFVRRGVYEPSIMLLLAYKNLFNFANIELYFRDIRGWAKLPKVPKVDLDAVLGKIKRGLDMEISLPEWYKEVSVERMRELFEHNKRLLQDHA